MSNSSVVDQQENTHEIEHRQRSATRSVKTPAKNNNITNRAKSPLKPSNFSKFKTTNVIDLV